ncbi:MAG: tetratricopeptide repeat protein [Cyclobacteriaceae bacterium]|nr:tetratricopeptide repeat protein [Cyclobacteriaceae bacterium]
MGENFKRKDELNTLIKTFEKHLKNHTLEFYQIEQLEEIISHYIELGKNKMALKACSIAIDQYPYSTSLMIEKAQILSNLEQFDKSLEILETAMALQPNDPEIFTMKGNLYLVQGLYEKAIKNYQKAIPLSEDKADLHYQIGLAYQNAFKYNKAIEYYKKTIEIDIIHENALYELAYCLDITEQLEHSISYYKKFIDQDPYSHYAWYNLGIVFNKLGKFDEAINAYEYATLIDENFGSAFFNLGNSFMSLEKYTQAIDAYKKTLEIEGASAETYCSLAETYEKLEHHELAVKYYQKAVKLDSFYDEAWFGVGKCLASQNKWYEAIHFLNRALKLDCENYLYWKKVAEAEYHVGNLVSSLDAYEEASMLNPEDLEIILDWSYIYYEQGEYEKALEIVVNTLSDLPEEADLYYRAAAYLLALGKYKEAYNYLENALVLNYDKHVDLLEFFPKLETQKALFRIIDQFRKNNK